MRDIRNVVYAKGAFSNYLMLEQHSTIKSLDHNLPAGVPNVSLAEASTRYGAEVIPLVEHQQLDALWWGLRVRGSGKDKGATRSSEVEFQVTGVKGPGSLVGYLTGTFGQPRVFANSADGFQPADEYKADSMRLPADAHTHMSWGFSKPGVYTMDFNTRLINQGQQPQAAATGTVTIAVGEDPRANSQFAGKRVIDIGHTDIAVDLDTSEMYFWSDLGEGASAQLRRLDLDKAVLWVPPKAMVEVPASPEFRFLGPPGERVYQLPQAVLGAHVHGEIDPHLWLNVKNVKAYVQTIRDVVTGIDPQGASTYADNTARYMATLDETDRHVADMLAGIEPSRRHLITTHDAYAYLAKTYGLQVAGFVAPNPAVEPSMAQRKKLGQTLRDLKVPAVFLEPTVARDTSVLASIAADEGVQLCTIYSDALDRRVTSYVELMRFNANSISRCLRKENS